MLLMALVIPIQHQGLCISLENLIAGFTWMQDSGLVERTIDTTIKENLLINFVTELMR